jgi:hypothetical protein
MSSREDSGSPNLLDEFFASSAPAGEEGQEPSDEQREEEEAVEVVDDEVEPVAEGEAPAPIAQARRSLPPPPPSMRGSNRRISQPPPVGRTAAFGATPPAPPSLRVTWPGIQDGPAPDRASAPPSLDALDASDASAEPQPDPFAGAGASRFDPETSPGGFGSDGSFIEDEGPATVQGSFEDASASVHEEEREPPRPPGIFDVGSPEEAVERPSGETNMASALAGSLSLRGDTPSGPESPVASAPAAGAGDANFQELPVPPAMLSEPSSGASSAWPSPEKIDEWDDDWAPSLSALGARDPSKTSATPAPIGAAPTERTPFRLSLPPPPPPPVKRATLPLPRVVQEEAAAAEVPAVAMAVEEGVEAPLEVTAEVPEPSIEVSPFEASDEPSREDLTRPLPPTELARLAASEGEALERAESELLRDDVTIPLPGLEERAAAGYDGPLFPALPDPYTSETDLTRPLIPLSGGSGSVPRSLILPPLRPPLDALADGDVAHAVSVPPPTVGTMETAPSIQITRGDSGNSEYTPTSQLQRPFNPTSTSPGLRGVLPPIPKPAPIPSDFVRRGPSPSVAPVAGSVFPPAGPARRKWYIGLAAAVFGVLALGFALRSRSGSLIVTVAGPSGAAVPGVSVRVDGTERCTSAPCVVKDLKAGMHLVSAAGAGLQASADRAVVLESGEQVAHHIVLSGEERSTAGLSVAAIGTGLHVQVDGRDVGAPPVTLNDVTPGEHTVRILGAERYYQPYEEVVRLERGEVRSLGPVRLRVLRGRLDLRSGDGSDGAMVSVDGRRVWHLPASIELSAEESHEVTAVKAGYNALTQEVVFDGTAERAVTISFGPDLGGAAGPAPAPAFHVATSTASRAPSSAHASAPAAAVAVAPTSGVATLDITSTPPAAVVVNGRPLGTTPLHGVHVGAGKQTVLFVHPSLGRKVASANVAPGGRATIGVKF